MIAARRRRGCRAPRDSGKLPSAVGCAGRSGKSRRDRNQQRSRFRHPQAYLFRWIDGFGKFATPPCNPSKINVVNVDPPAHPTVIQSKSVAAVISFEPYLDLSAQNGAKVVATGVGYTMADFKKPGKIWSGQITLYVRDSFVQQHKDVLVAYLKALQKANTWINADKVRASKVLAPLFGLKQSLLLKVLKRNIYGLAIDKTSMNDVTDVGEFMVKDH